MSVINVGSVSLGSTDQLTRIEKNIDTLIDSISATSLVFTPLSFSPSFSINSSDGWVVSPANLENIIDNDTNTSTNTFEVTGAAWRWGELIINPNITLSTFTKIQLLIGIKSNLNNERPACEVSVFCQGGWVNIWSVFGIRMSDITNTNFLIDIITPFNWSQLKIKIWDLGSYGTRCTIFDFKLWSVS